jgi:hypothetical protein
VGRGVEKEDNFVSFLHRFIAVCLYRIINKHAQDRCVKRFYLLLFLVDNGKDFGKCIYCGFDKV